MARLPTPGGDNGNWGTVLNDFLTQSHNADGTIKASSLPADQAPGTASLRTLGTGPNQAAAGDHTHYGTSGRYLTPAQVTASKVHFYLGAGASNQTTTGSGSGTYPVFDTMDGDSDLYEISDSPSYWGSNVPKILTPGEYLVSFSVDWPDNNTGDRQLGMDVFNEADLMPWYQVFEHTQAGAGLALFNTGHQFLQERVIVWPGTEPAGLGISLRQTSGGNLVIPKNNNDLDLWVCKIVAFD